MKILMDGSIDRIWRSMAIYGDLCERTVRYEINIASVELRRTEVGERSSLVLASALDGDACGKRHKIWTIKFLQRIIDQSHTSLAKS